MSSQLLVDLFAEDYAQEAFLKPLIEHLCRELRFNAHVRVQSARGGAPRALSEYKAYQRLLQQRVIQPPPDIIVVARDGDCKTRSLRQQEIRGATLPQWHSRLVIACPEPHIERWYLVDLEALRAALGFTGTVRRFRKSCKRDVYKKALGDVVRASGYPPTLRGVEHAPELVAAMDLRQPPDRSLRAFLSDFRGILRQLLRTSDSPLGP